MKRLIRNAIQTPDGTILESTARHDYKEYIDVDTGEWFMVDGGLVYQRRSTNVVGKDLTLYDDEPHEVQRDVLTWGTYGKTGDDPYQKVKVKDMTTGHILAVLAECKPLIQLENCMKKELDLRS